MSILPLLLLTVGFKPFGAYGLTQIINRQVKNNLNFNLKRKMSVLVRLESTIGKYEGALGKLAKHNL